MTWATCLISLCFTLHMIQWSAMAKTWMRAWRVHRLHQVDLCSKTCYCARLSPRWRKKTQATICMFTLNLTGTIDCMIGTHTHTHTHMSEYVWRNVLVCGLWNPKCRGCPKNPSDQQTAFIDDQHTFMAAACAWFILDQVFLDVLDLKVNWGEMLSGLECIFKDRWCWL